MKVLKVFEAFAGYGSQRMALENIGVPHEVVAISEIDKFAIKSYEAIHGETFNLGDITKIKIEDVPDHDLFTYSFPCQDISVAGKQAGFDKGSGTRSGLLWECERIISSKKPKYLLMENVKNLVGKKFMGGFQEWIDYLESVGYSNYWQVLNAKDYGIPQNRERVFMVSILGDHTPYQFPEPFKLEMKLKDILEEVVDEKYYLSEERTEKLISGVELNVVEPTLCGVSMNRNEINSEVEVAHTLLARDYKGFGNQNMTGVVLGVGHHPFSKKLEFNGYRDLSPTLLATDYKAPKTALIGVVSKKEFGRMGEQAVETQNKLKLKHVETLNPWNKKQSSRDGVAPTLTTRPEGFKTTINVIDQYRVRKLTPLECWRLMGVKDEIFYKAQEVNSNSQLYKQAGNSIVVNVLEGIFRNML